jgi:hypothetical protein
MRSEIEMSSASSEGGIGVMHDNEMGSMPDIPAPMDWAKSRVRSQNRCFLIAIGTFLIVGAVYVIGGVYSADNVDTLVEKYDAQSGVVDQEFDNAKMQEAFQQNQQGKNGHAANNWYQKNHGKDNPFGNANAIAHGNLSTWGKHAQNRTQGAHAAAMARWNRTHPGQPFPGHSGTNGLVPNHNSGHTTGSGSTGGSGALPGGHNSNTGSTSGSGGNLGGDHCALQDHIYPGDWMQATVTKSDGLKYVIVEKLDHDAAAFT